MPQNTNNFLQDILTALEICEETEEDIQAVYLIELRYSPYDPDYGQEWVEPFIEDDTGNYLSWSYCRDKFNYNYDAGFGSQDCHDIVIYTTDTIYYVHEYDGSTSICWVSRNPGPLIK